jgi:hypothetical protein
MADRGPHCAPSSGSRATDAGSLGSSVDTGTENSGLTLQVDHTMGAGHLDALNLLKEHGVRESRGASLSSGDSRPPERANPRRWEFNRDAPLGIFDERPRIRNRANGTRSP